MKNKRKILLTFGGIITVIWALATIYLAITAEEMEILLAAIVFVAGGYLLTLYFLIIGMITAETKLGRRSSIFGLIALILVPFLYYAMDEMNEYLYHKKLANTEVTEEMAEQIYNQEMNSRFVEKGDPFYTNSNGDIKIVLTINSDHFKEGYIDTYKEFEQIAARQGYTGEEKEEFMQEQMVEEYLGRVILPARKFHKIWKQSTQPKKITVQLWNQEELIFQTVSTDKFNIKGEDDIVEYMYQMSVEMTNQLIK